MKVANVTLCGIAWGRKYIEELFAAYRRFEQSIKFEKVLFFIDEPAERDGEIEFVQLPHYFSLEQDFKLPVVGYASSEKLNPYCYFLMKDLAQHIHTSHVLLFQNDGWIVNPQAWDDEFLQFDYIGAIWPLPAGNNKRVGNGGFSLRSKKLCDVLANDRKILAAAPEDIQICFHFREYLCSQYGIKFAPEKVADRFSVEYHAHYTGQFGFHGLRHLQKIGEAMKNIEAT